MFSAVAHSSFVPSRRERDHGSLRPPIPGAEAQPATKGKRDRKLRADVFEVPANTSKAEAIFDLWPLWRRGLLAEAITARRDLMAGRALRTLILATEEADEPWIAASKVRIGAQEQQMIRAQATATIATWRSSRQNDVREAINRQFTPRRWGGAARRRFDALPVERREALEADIAELRHELHAINAQQAWMVPTDTAVMRKLDGALVPVSDRARRLARAIFLGIAARHRWPRFEKLAMRLDDRAGFSLDGSKVWLEPAHHGGLFAWWLHLKPTGAKAPVLLPIRGWGRDREDGRGTGLARPGTLAKTLNFFLGDDGKLKVALTRDLTEVFSESRDAYHPLTDVLSLDFGLRSLFATNFGDLLGRGFLGKIEPVAHRADAEAARMQKAGKKPRESERYLKLVTRLKAMIETEVNRVLNHAVALYRPRVLAVEKLDFRGAGLGRRMNRLLTNCGRGAVAKKLADLEDRYGIEIHEVEPAYTSKTCSSCGYVDAKQQSGEKFHCRHCGRSSSWFCVADEGSSGAFKAKNGRSPKHADVNGARNIAKAVSGQPADHETATGDGRSDLPGASSPAGRKRSRKTSSSPRNRSFTLRDIVRRFDESMTDLGSVSRPKRGKSGARESAPDPRLTNPYWRRHSALLKGKSAGPRNTEAAAFAVAT